jgi:mRNA-capping enzyme
MLQTGSENRQLIFLYERGKKKLMDGTRVVFPGKDAFNSMSVQLFRTIMHSVTMFIIH